MSGKQTFKSKTFAGNTFSSGNWNGVGFSLPLINPSNTSRVNIYAPITANLTTTDVYADVGLPWLKANFKNGNLFIINNGGTGNSLTYQVFGSLDGSNYSITLLPPTIIAVGKSQILNITKYFAAIKVQVKSTSATNPTTCLINGIAYQ